jgi:hypothetical protein
VVWALRIPNGSAHANVDRGTASLHVRELCVFDAFTVPNSLAGVNRAVNLVLATFNSLEMEWTATGAPQTVNEPVNHMRGTFVEATATIEVTATTPGTLETTLSNGHGFRFVSDPAATTISHFALIGREQNGVYY